MPAGKYAKETLTNLDVWSKVQSKVVYSKDVRQVLSYIETGNADAGIVYRTDALSSDQVETVETAKSDLHTPIVYPLGIVKIQSTGNSLRNFINSCKATKPSRRWKSTDLRRADRRYA